MTKSAMHLRRSTNLRHSSPKVKARAAAAREVNPDTQVQIQEENPTRAIPAILQPVHGVGANRATNLASPTLRVSVKQAHASSSTANAAPCQISIRPTSPRGRRCKRKSRNQPRPRIKSAARIEVVQPAVARTRTPVDTHPERDNRQPTLARQFATTGRRNAHATAGTGRGSVTSLIQFSHRHPTSQHQVPTPTAAPTPTPMDRGSRKQGWRVSTRHPVGTQRKAPRRWLLQGTPSMVPHISMTPFLSAGLPAPLQINININHIMTTTMARLLTMTLQQFPPARQTSDATARQTPALQIGICHKDTRRVPKLT